MTRIENAIKAVEAMQRREAKQGPARQPSAGARALAVRQQPAFKVARGEAGARKGTAEGRAAGVGAPDNEMLAQGIASLEGAFTSMQDRLSELKSLHFQLSEWGEARAAAEPAPVSPVEAAPPAASSAAQVSPVGQAPPRRR